jgi:hypothetical protein
MRHSLAVLDGFRTNTLTMVLGLDTETLDQ